MSLKKLILSVIVPLSLLAAWQSAVTFGWWPKTLIAPPTDVLVDFARLAWSGEILSHSMVSMERAFGGFLLGSILAIVVGSLVGVFKIAEWMMVPSIQALSPIPPTAWIPLLIILLGIGEASKITLIAIGAFGVVYVNTVHGIRSADRKLVELAATIEKPKRDLIFYVLLPSAAPSIVTGMRVALGQTWMLLIAAEMVAAKLVSSSNRLDGRGLGWLIYDARNFSRADDMIVGMIAIGIIGKISDLLVARLEQRLFRWREVFGGI